MGAFYSKRNLAKNYDLSVNADFMANDGIRKSLKRLDAIVQIFSMGGEWDCQRHQFVATLLILFGCFGKTVREQMLKGRQLVETER
jgi:hypothetical protein